MKYSIQSPSILEGIRRAFGIQGKFHGELDGVVSPVAVVSDLTTRPAAVAAAGFAALTQPAVGTDDLWVQLSNPAETGVDLQLQGFIASHNETRARELEIWIYGGLLTTSVGTGVYVDRRGRVGGTASDVGPRATRGIIRSEVGSLTPGDKIGELMIAQDGEIFYDVSRYGWVLPPTGNITLKLDNAAQNVSLFVTFLWSEAVQSSRRVVGV